MENNNLTDYESNKPELQSPNPITGVEPPNSASVQTPSQNPEASKGNPSPVISVFRSEPHKIRLKSKKAWLIFGGIAFLILLLVAGGVYYFVFRSSSKLSIFSSLPKPSQYNCQTTTLTYYPDQHLNFEMPSCWSITSDGIASSNQTAIKEGYCVVPGSDKNSIDGLPNYKPCSGTYNVPDVTLTIDELPGNNEPTIQAWMDWQFAYGVSHAGASYLPNPIYFSTTFNGQPAAYLNNSTPDEGGSQTTPSLAPARLPAIIPACVFNGGCYILWDNNVYEIYDTNWYGINTDNQQVFKLIESIKFE